MNDPCARVLVIGVDSAEPTLLQKMVRDGLLPNLASLLNPGVSGRVQNPTGFESGSVWQSFHTGKVPGQHPMYDGLRYFNPQTYEFSYLTPEEIATDNIWQYLSKQGKRCAVIDAPYCQVTGEFNGTIITDYAVHDAAYGSDIIKFSTYPSEVAQEVLDLVGPDPTESIQSDNRLTESVDQCRAFRDMYFERIEKKGRLAKHFLQKGGWDYFEAVFTEPHSVGHKLWHVADQTHDEYSPKLNAALGDPLYDLNLLMDKAIGEILSCVDERTLVLFYMSHGMEPHYTGTELLDRVLSNLENGVRSHGEKSIKEKMRGVWRAVPTETRAKLNPIKKYFAGTLSPKEGVFSGNRRNRRFFEVYASYRTSGIRINLQGRESNGLVNPQDYPALLDQLTEDLNALVNLDSGEKLVDEILRPRDLYEGDYVESLPDLLVTWNRNGPIHNVYSEKVGNIKRAFPMGRTGDHSPYGFFAAIGGDLRSQKLNEGVEAIDFFPTICHALDVNADNYDGKRIASVGRFKTTHKAEIAT